MRIDVIIRRILVLICVLGTFVTGAYARSGADSTVVRSFRISYPVNDTRLHENYLDNYRKLQHIREYFKESPRVDSIVIYSYASPEGPYRLNRRLAEERGRRARQYLLEHLPEGVDFPDSLIIVSPTAENWDGLYEMVSELYPYEDRQDVLDLLTRTDISNDRKKILLKKINGGRPWVYIRDNILPQLRYATWVAEWVYVRALEDPVPPVPVPQSDTLSPYPFSPLDRTKGLGNRPQEYAEKIILALKTNLLYDVLSLTNFSVEFPVYKDNLSVLYYHQFPWWTWGKADNEYCTRFLGIGGEFRWWFRPSGRFNGHFLGVYAESGKYDFEYQRHICYQGEFSTTGLTYGYAMPIGRNLNLEFSVSAGYASIAYRGYTPSENYEILWRDPENAGRLHYLGPTKAQISLVIPIRVVTRKGGVR